MAETSTATEMEAYRAALARKAKKSLFYNLWKYKNLYVMFLPALVGFTLFRYIPAIGGFAVALTDYNVIEGFFHSSWAGGRFFLQFFKDPFFLRLIRNTLLIGFYGLLFGFPAPIILALLLNEVKHGTFKRVTQSISYLPHFVSTVVLVGMMYTLLGAEGIVNQLLKSIGIGRMDFVGSPQWFRPLYIGSGIWQGIGWGSIIYLAALTGINPELYEAATIDGAGRFQQAMRITIPGIAPTVTIMLIFAVGGMISVGFEKVYLMYNPGIYNVADVIETYVYRRGIENMQFSYAGAVGLFSSVIGLILIVTANYMSRFISDSSLW